jgi:hypothetical protein
MVSSPRCGPAASTWSTEATDHAPDERDSFGRLIEMLGDVLGVAN